MIFHGDYFIGADHVDPVYRTRKKTILKNLIKNQMTRESLGEELRVLYVAMTRAKEKLILTGIKKDDIDWNAKGEVTAIDRLSGRSYFDWIKKALPMIPKQDYRLKIYTLEDLLWQQEGNELLHEMNRQIFYERLNDQIPNENVKALKESFAYHYRNEAETKGRLKYSVSEIKRMSQAADTEEVMYSSVSMEKEKRIPSFVKKTEKISAASKGTIIHKVFELLDFSKDYTMKSLNEDIERWISLGKLKKEYEKVIYRKEILALTRSELGKRMKEAAQKKLLYKERQFVTGIPFSDMDKEAKTDDFVVVQGIIDVYFEEEDKIILVDYKTDRVREGGEDILIRRYRAQMESYQQALEKITGKCVKEIYIYSVTLARNNSRACMKFLICHILRIENDKSERKKIMPKEKDFIEKTFEEMNEMERLKYETAAELGLLDQLKKSGWKSLSASETGRLGGIMNRKIRKQKESQENTKGS